MNPAHPFANQESPQPAETPASGLPPAGDPFAAGLERNRRIRLVLYCLAGLAVIGGLLYFFLVANKGTILIIDNEKDLTITINDQPAKTSSDPRGYRISEYAGQYRLKIVKADYLPFIQDVSVSRGETTVVRPVFTFAPKSQQSPGVSTVDFVRPSADQRAIYYLGNQRQTIYRMEIASQAQIPLTDTPLQGVQDIEWSSNPDVALIVQSDGTYLREIPKFDFEKQTLVKIGGSEMESAVWDPTNPDRIAFAYSSPLGEHSLVFSDKRATNLERKANISGLTNPKLVWASDASALLLIDRSPDYSRNNLWVYTTADGVFKQITQEGNVLDASFSPNSDTILYESYASDPANPLGATLSTIKRDGSSAIRLGITGHVAQAAWKDATSFFLPSLSSNSLTLYTVDGRHSDVPFAFSNPATIQGMHYFPDSKTLIFHTGSAIYTVELGE